MKFNSRKVNLGLMSLTSRKNNDEVCLVTLFYFEVPYDIGFEC